MKNGASPLSTACQNGHESIVEMLLRSGAYINLYEQSKYNPMSIACRKGYASIVQLLVIYATDID